MDVTAEATRLTKRFGERVAVHELSFTAGSGEIVGLLGPNGAGKSSLMRILATITRPTSGQVTFNGIDIVAGPNRLRRNLGYLPQDFGVHPHLTAREFLSYRRTQPSRGSCPLIVDVHPFLRSNGANNPRMYACA